jgi:hypothetical protein
MVAWAAFHIALVCRQSLVWRLLVTWQPKARVWKHQHVDESPYRSRELPEESEIFPGLIFGPIVLPCYPEADPKPNPKRPTGLRRRFFVGFWEAGSHSRPKNQPRKDFRFFRNLSRPISRQYRSAAKRPFSVVAASLVWTWRQTQVVREKYEPAALAVQYVVLTSYGDSKQKTAWEVSARHLSQVGYKGCIT